MPDDLQRPCSVIRSREVNLRTCDPWVEVEKTTHLQIFSAAQT